MNNKDLGKKIVIILQVISGIGLLVVILLLIKVYTSDKKVQSNAFNKLEVHELSTNSTYKANINNKELTINNDDYYTMINNRKLNYLANKVYVTNKLLILSTVSQNGEILYFYTPELSELIYDNRDLRYQGLELEDGKIKANVLNTKYLDGHIGFDFTIVECDSNNTNKISSVKDELIKYKDDIVKGEVLFSYDGNNLSQVFLSRKTIWTIYGDDIENDTDKYCVIVNIM